MKTTPYTIRLFMPTGVPSSLKVIEKMNWTGMGIETSRRDWEKHKSRDEFNRAGIYILVGFDEGEEIPSIYIGQGDPICNRINSHVKNKDFWDRAIAFVSSNYGLNRAHITWLEWSLIKTAQEAKRCHVNNLTSPKEPTISEFEKADLNRFLNEILSILPLIELKVFEKPEKIVIEETRIRQSQDELNTIVVPAQEDGFKEVFLGEDCWYAIRIGGGKLDQIEYIAAYQTSPISAVTHYAEVESIEPYGEGDKYKLNFKNKAIKINAIPYGNAKQGTMQSPRYTSFKKLMQAKVLDDLF